MITFTSVKPRESEILFREVEQCCSEELFAAFSCNVCLHDISKPTSKTSSQDL